MKNRLDLTSFDIVWFSKSTKFKLYRPRLVQALDEDYDVECNSENWYQFERQLNCFFIREFLGLSLNQMDMPIGITQFTGGLVKFLMKINKPVIKYSWDNIWCGGLIIGPYFLDTGDSCLNMPRQTDLGLQNSLLFQATEIIW